ncbi:MAG: cytidylate kinase-like family protein, partial [Clostridia bacterium]|nr:cytidylate kinase-like family protein [Clostridia bacterium]
YGTNGRAIARRVADELGWHYYDAELIQLAAKKLDRTVDEVEPYDDQEVIRTNSHGGRYVGGAFPYYFSDRKKKAELFAAERQIIGEIAAGEEDAVIVGRAADYILTRAGHPDLFRVLISASYENRYLNVVEEFGIPKGSTAREEIKLIDKARYQYYEAITGQDFNCPKYRDVVINNEWHDDDYTVRMILLLVGQRFPEN